MDNKSLAHTKWNCTYHIVIIPKYRRKVMYGTIRQDVRQIIIKLCKMQNVELVVRAAKKMPDTKLIKLSIFLLYREIGCWGIEFRRKN